MRRVTGLMAEFADHHALLRALEEAQAAGFRRIEAFSPYPLQAAAERLGVRTSAIPWIAAIAGLLGAATQYYAQYWMNAVDYPLNVGGRPLDSWPAFLPATLIVAVLWAGAATLLGLLIILRLPRLHHPVFEVPGFDRASEDRFFLCILADDPAYEPGAVRAVLDRGGPIVIREVPACD